MNQALYSTDLTGGIEEPDTDAVTKSAENVSLAWTVPGMDLSASNVSVIAHYANGTTRVVPEEYVQVNTEIGDDTVHINEYPLGKNDPSSVQFRLRIAGEEELRSASKTVTNPQQSGDLPRLDSISLGTLTPGPSETVSVELNPAQMSSFRRVTNVTAYSPDGSEVTTTSVSDGDTFSFTTDGTGVHTLRVDIETTNGNTVTLPVRIKALASDISRPPSITVRDSPIGQYALVGDGLAGAEISTDAGAKQTTVVAKLKEESSLPSNIDVHLEEIALAGTAETSVTVVRGEAEQRISKHVPVTLHFRKPTDDVLVRRNGEPLSADGNSKGQTRTTGKALIVETYIDESGSVTVKRVNDPGWLEKLAFQGDQWVRGLSLGFIATPLPGSMSSAVIVDTGSGTPLAVAESTPWGVNVVPIAELLQASASAGPDDTAAVTEVVG